MRETFNGIEPMCQHYIRIFKHELHRKYYSCKQFIQYLKNNSTILYIWFQWKCCAWGADYFSKNHFYTLPQNQKKVSKSFAHFYNDYKLQYFQILLLVLHKSIYDIKNILGRKTYYVNLNNICKLYVKWDIFEVTSRNLVKRIHLVFQATF